MSPKKNPILPNNLLNFENAILKTNFIFEAYEIKKLKFQKR